MVVWSEIDRFCEHLVNFADDRVSGIYNFWNSLDQDSKLFLVVTVGVAGVIISILIIVTLINVILTLRIRVVNNKRLENVVFRHSCLISELGRLHARRMEIERDITVLSGYISDGNKQLSDMKNGKGNSGFVSEEGEKTQESSVDTVDGVESIDKVQDNAVTQVNVQSSRNKEDIENIEKTLRKNESVLLGYKIEQEVVSHLQISFYNELYNKILANDKMKLKYRKITIIPSGGGGTGPSFSLNKSSNNSGVGVLAETECKHCPV